MRALLCCLLLTATYSLAEEAPKPQYIYRAEVVRVINGNTVSLNIDLGFKVWSHGQTLPLLNVPLSEDKDAAFESANRLRELLKDRSEIIVRTTRDQKGNIFADLWADDVHINEAMLEKQ